MAFFKFRFPGQNSSNDGPAPGPSESIEIVRRRARHRLTGAVVLVSMSVVGFPLLFDTQPRPVAVDTPIVVPDKQKTPALTSHIPIPVDQAPAKPLLPSAQAIVPTQSSLDVSEAVLPKPVATPSEKVADLPAGKMADKGSEKPAEKQVAAKSEVKTDPRPAPKPKDDGLKAQALLDGKPAKTSKGRLVIQVGAFSDVAKVRDVRNKLDQAGLKTYTQVVEKDGKSTTRIRVGPFDTKEDADKAAARIRKLDLPAVVQKL
ncbi:MAG: SPOR domain-containing protein [Limnohabitans sp.]|uniref:SPOR domain-containing protein n=1 Tax=Limnohabitans sp. TaxID=1907725 RepID=UPI0025FDFA05|nr:SPOR domain-containing protein [Limnohabitans sp.]MCO4088135.1 SPOR domain-containing protein [Limnohabitans sp.]